MLKKFRYTTTMVVTYAYEVDVPDGMDANEVAERLLDNDEFYRRYVEADPADAEVSMSVVVSDNTYGGPDLTADDVTYYLKED